MISYIKTAIAQLCTININGRSTMARQPRSRAFCFTWNNPLATSEALLESIPGYTYLTFGREVGENGTPHLQGYIRFAHGKTLRSARTFLLGCHVEPAVTTGAAIEYCQKDGNFVEFGIRPVDPVTNGDNERERWENAWENAKVGNLEAIPPDIRLRQYSAIRRIQKDFMVPPNLLPGPCGIWVYGRSGVGKTHSVYQSHPDLYSKNASKNWDGYQNEDVVLFDDIDPTQCSWITRFLKIWADRYPFIADNKGGSVIIRPKTFIVTSQYTIDELFTDEPTREALNRRFTRIIKESRDDDITAALIAVQLVI